MIIHAMFALNWFTGFRGKIFSTFSHRAYVKTMSTDGGHLEFPIGTKNIFFAAVHPMIIHALFALNWFTGFRGKIFQHFPIGSYVKTMSADGSHLEFPISTKKA